MYTSYFSQKNWSFLVNLNQIFKKIWRKFQSQNVRKSYQHTAAAARVHSSSSRLAKGFSNWRKVLFSAKLNLTESRIAFKLSYIHYTILYRAKEAILKTKIFSKENLLRKWNHRKNDTHFAFYRNKNVDILNEITKQNISSVPTRFLPLTVSVIVRARGKLVRLELEVTC